MNKGKKTEVDAGRVCFSGACALDPQHEAHLGLCPGRPKGAGTAELIETLTERTRLLRLSLEVLAEQSVMSILNPEEVRAVYAAALDLEHVFARLRRAMEHESVVLMAAERRAEYRVGGGR